MPPDAPAIAVEMAADEAQEMTARIMAEASELADGRLFVRVVQVAPHLPRSR